jgi:hypothetical protein
MRTSFHHQPEAQHPIFQLSTSWQADYPIFRSEPDIESTSPKTEFAHSGHKRARIPHCGGAPDLLLTNSLCCSELIG